MGMFSKKDGYKKIASDNLEVNSTATQPISLDEERKMIDEKIAKIENETYKNTTPVVKSISDEMRVRIINKIKEKELRYLECQAEMLRCESAANALQELLNG